MKTQRITLSVGLPFFVVLFVLVSSSAEAKNTYLVKKPQTEIAARLSKGEGGVVVGYEFHILKKGFNIDSVGTPQELIDVGTTTYPVLKGRHALAELIIQAPGSREQINIKHNNELGCFVFMGPPGEYIISQVYYFGWVNEFWRRMYLHVTIEPGQIKYISTIQHLTLGFRTKFLQRPDDSSFILWRYMPSEFKSGLIDILQQQSRPLVFEEVKDSGGFENSFKGGPLCLIKIYGGSVRD